MTPGKTLKFCMVTTFYPPYHFGGDGVFVYRLAEALADRGHQVDVIHSEDAYHLQHPSKPDIEFTHHPNVKRYPLRSRMLRLATMAAHQLGRPAFYGPRLRHLLRAGNYDVIHYHNISLMGGPGVLRLGQGVKLYTAHEYWLVCPTHVLFAFNREACTQRRCTACTLHSRRPPQPWRYTGMIQRCTHHVDRFLMPSRFALEKHRDEGLVGPMEVLPHFVPSVPKPIVSSQQYERPYFLFVGRLELLKGVQDLLRLFADYREADLVIVGTGSFEPVLREIAMQLPHVRFMGQVHPQRLAELYQRACAVLVPSLCYETFGLTAVEALSHGTPVIARRIGALPEVIEQSGGGFTFGSLDECRAAMEAIRTQPQLREELGQRGTEAVRKHWSLEGHLSRYLDLIHSQIEKKTFLSASSSARRPHRAVRLEHNKEWEAQDRRIVIAATRRVPRVVPILTYHSLDDSGSVISTSKEMFRKQMLALRDWGFHGIRLGDLLDAWEGKGSIPARPVVLTFDDGFRNFLEDAAPVLREVGFRATLFAVPGHCGGTNDWPTDPPGIPRLPLLSWSDLRDLAADGFEIGAHSMTHPPLAALTQAAAEREIVGSKEVLEDCLGRAVDVFAYPYGVANRSNRAVVRRNFRAACGVGLGQARLSDDRAELRRIDMYYYRQPAFFRLFPTPLGQAYVALRAIGRGCRRLLQSLPGGGF